MTAEKRTFQTEVNKLLDLMIHSLYSHPEIFLRELISNGSDAIDKARYLSQTDESVKPAGGEWRIELIADKDAGTLTVRDNGVGMTHDEVIEALGTIAHSGTKEFLALLDSRDGEASPDLIGQFGVGFYSSFMVADEVTVVTRKAGEGSPAVRWSSTADGTYTLDEAEKAEPGTDVILHLKDDAKSYLDEWELRRVVRRYSDFIEYPVVMEVERTKPDPADDKKTITERKTETLNSQKAIWLKSPSEVDEEAYHDFYRHISHDAEAPARVVHYRAEGMNEFSVLLFLPKRAPVDLFQREHKYGPTLYVRRVQIMDNCEELLPPYLRFVKGVVESADLPLNVSREILQDNRQVDQIRKSITKKVLDTLADMQKEDMEVYRRFHDEFGRVLKEGIHYDYERQKAVADLLLFESTKTEAGSVTTLARVKEGMADEQEALYYITGPSRAEVETSPYLEAFRKKDIEVLFFTDEIDDFIANRLGSYDGKPLKSVLKGDLDLDEDEGREEKAKACAGLVEFLGDRLKDHVAEVRVSGRLTDSAVCLVAGADDLDRGTEAMLKALGQDVPERKRILEINPDHPVIVGMKAQFEKDRTAHVLDDCAGLLLDQAVLLEGGRPADPAAFARRMSRVMEERLGERD